MDVTSSRLSKTNQSVKNYSSGDEFASLKSTWVDIYGSAISQKKEDNYVGYKAGVGGTTAGIDKTLYPGWVMGVGVNHARSRVKYKQDDFFLLKFNTYQGFLYNNFNYKMKYCDYYVSLVFNYGFSLYKKEREYDIGALRADSTSRFSGDLYGAAIETGYYFSYRNIYLNPFARFNYYYAIQKKHHEQIKNDEDLFVNKVITKKMDVTGGGILKINYNQKTYLLKGMYTRTLSLDNNRFYHFIGDVESQGLRSNKAKEAITAGAGMEFKFDCLKLVFMYEMTRKSRYFKQTGFMNLSYAF